MACAHPANAIDRSKNGKGKSAIAVGRSNAILGTYRPMEAAVFLDRDGVIIEDVGYPHELNTINFLPGASAGIRALNEAGFKVIVVTNQSGIARGYFTEQTVEKVNTFIQESLAGQGATIDKFYYCPHHIDGTVKQYKVECYCRKPNPGMIETAAREFDIDLKRSFVIGDKDSDIGAGCNAGCKTILLTNGKSADSTVRGAFIPGHLARDLQEAAEWLIDFKRREEEMGRRSPVG